MGDLTQLLNEWRCLSEGEHEAILAQDWKRLGALQARKAALQPDITRLTAGSRGQSDDIQALVLELISSESANAQLISRLREAAENEFSETNRAAGQLRDIHRAYAAGSSGHWSSYS
jgi:hypothetical protein